VKFWLDKFESNIRRDKEVKKLLRKLGWNVLIIWECELRSPDRLSKRLNKALRRDLGRNADSLRQVHNGSIS